MPDPDVNTPLARATFRGRQAVAVATPLRIAWAFVSCALTVLFMWLVLVDDPLGGEPVAMLALPPLNGDAGGPGAQDGIVFRNGLGPEDDTGEAVAQAPAPEAAPAAEDQIDPLDAQFDALAEASAGDGHTSLTPAPVQAVSEDGAHGPLPRISVDGATPAHVYARAMSDRESDPAVAKIAILVSGLGLSASGTSLAMNLLPEQVTFAFAPYAQGLQEWVDRARQAGHEVMLQLPMEPFDYPDNDPGPHTLLTTLAPQENIRRLEWLMSRVSGYFGITNYMGAKFTAAPDALRIVLNQINLRGLAYVEDGSSSRSNTPQLSRQVGLKATTADLIIDAQPSADAIDTALQRLETLALERGIALGSATGLPVTVEHIAAWSKFLEAKGILLIPVSGAIDLRENLS